MYSKLKTYFLGIGWFSLSLCTSAANDIITKYTGLNIPSSEVTFFRLFFGAMTILPFIAYYGINTLKTSRPMVHVSRGVLLFLAMTAWTYGLTIAPVTTATVISFSIPIFFLTLAIFFLKESVIWQRWVATIVGFIGILVTLKPTESAFNIDVFIFVIAAVMFAALDIINKKFVIKESMLSMLFYSGLLASFFAGIMSFSNWVQPSAQDLFLLFILGSSGNLMLFFLLKAFALVDATATAPYRYLELILSSIAAYIVFNEVPNHSTIIGAMIIIPTTLFIIYSEKKFLVKNGAI